MIHRILKNITCKPDEPNKCADIILAKLKLKGINVIGDSSGEQMYLYVNHVQNNHYIALIIFDVEGQYEAIDPRELDHFKKTGKIKEFPVQKEMGHQGSKKFVGQMPTKKSISDAI